MKLFSKNEGGKVKKGLFGGIVAMVLIAALAIPTMAYYTPLAYEPYSATKYQSKRVQVTTGNTYMNSAPNPGAMNIMNLGVNEALVDSGVVEPWSYPVTNYRKYIGGKQGVGMVEGWVPEWQTKPVSYARNVTSHSRVALTAWSSHTGTVVAGADIPAGARLEHSSDGVLYAFSDGARVYIQGYWLNGNYTSRACFVNTNWAQGSVASYYVQFQQN